MKKKRPQHPKVVEAEEFRLVDKNRNTRAIWRLSDDGQPRLCLFDKLGRIRLSIYVAGAKVGIELMDKNETVRAALLAGNVGKPALLLLDKKEDVNVALEMVVDGRPGLDLYDKNGELRATLSVDRHDDLPDLALVDKNGKKRRATGTNREVKAALALYDKGGEPRALVSEEDDEFGV